VIGDNTVIHTASCLPNGLPATVTIGNFVTVQPNATLYSCTIEEDVLVGHKSVVLEGAYLEKGCVIGPNSVVPPGRVIPANQLWAGNPVQYPHYLDMSGI
jgi:gamma-carbonic anhydrase